MTLVKVLVIVVASVMACSASEIQRRVTPLMAHCITSLYDQLQKENRLDELSPDFMSVYEGIQVNSLEQPETMLLAAIEELQFFGFLV
jgi:hypothetical protein